MITKPCLFSLSSPWIPPGIKLGSESYFGDFVDGLGPAQIVGRQVLASPSMGDIQLAMFDRKGVLEVEVVRAKGLLPKPGSKILPGMNILLLKSPFYDLKVYFLIFFLPWSFFSLFSTVCEGLRDGGQKVFDEKENQSSAKNIRTILSTTIRI